ncbi:MAG TPA: bifunctional enoyl-CoA hydratase/phosphate acetyltransferase, partial [Burkholderiaceae bacterium]|nr:bifunctional enoyl-CoA hydratase/phosphate acetyltransferase [Burkholderiaceae bacterium]
MDPTRTGDPAAAAAHPRLHALIDVARAKASVRVPVLGVVYPCDPLAIDSAAAIAAAGIAHPVLIGPARAIAQAAAACNRSPGDFDTIDAPDDPRRSAQVAVGLVREGRLAALMKGSLHTDELLSAVVGRSGLRTGRRMSHAFVFDLPRYHKLLALSDCVCNIAPDLAAKRDIVTNALALLGNLGIAQPKVGVLAAVETVNPAIPATVDAAELVRLCRDGAWPAALIEGPFGFDNAFSAEAARIKRIESRVAGDADLLLVPDLNAGNLLYKSFVYVGAGECAGIMLGTQVPIVLTSRADSLLARTASAALAMLASDAGA